MYECIHMTVYMPLGCACMYACIHIFTACTCMYECTRMTVYMLISVYSEAVIGDMDVCVCVCCVCACVR